MPEPKLLIARLCRLVAGWGVWVQVGSSSAAHQEYMRTLRHCVNAAAVMAELSDPSAERALEEGCVL